MSEYVKQDHAVMPYWERLHNQPTDKSPILVTMHWMTGTAQAMPFLLDGIEFPVREIALQGTYPSGYEEGGYSWFEHERDFYDTFSEADQAPLIRKEADKIAKLITALREQYSGTIVVTGMSQGGDLSFQLATHHPQLIDVAIPMAGRLSEPMQPQKIASDNRPRVLVLQGAIDEIVTRADAEVAYQWLQVNNFDATLTVYDGVGHDISGDMIDVIREVLANL